MPATTSGGGWTRLPLPDTANTTYAGATKSINENGVILGTGGGGGDRARLWNAAAPYPIEILAGEQGLNNLNHVAGSTVSSSAHRARLWDGTQYVEIGAEPAALDGQRRQRLRLGGRPRRDRGLPERR